MEHSIPKEISYYQKQRDQLQLTLMYLKNVVERAQKEWADDASDSSLISDGEILGVVHDISAAAVKLYESKAHKIYGPSSGAL